MIAQAGLLSYRMGFQTPVAKSTCTQRSFPLSIRRKPDTQINGQIQNGRSACCMESLVTCKPENIQQSLSSTMKKPGLLKRSGCTD